MNRKTLIAVSLFALLVVILIFALRPATVTPPDGVETVPQDDSGELPEEAPEAPESESPPAEILQIPPPEVFQPEDGPTYETGSTLVHQVSSTEWLSQIARCYGAPVEAVLAANPLYNQNIIQPGSQVTVPEVGTAGAASGPPCVGSYVVQPGDTWASISEKVGAPADMLQRANPAPLLADAVIVVPAPAHAQPGSPAAPINLTHDLIFTVNKSLVRWNHATGNVEMYDVKGGAEIMDLATNASGSPILVKLAGPAGVGDAPSAEFGFVNLGASQITLNPQGFGAGSVPSTFSSHLLVSDDGGRAAYAFDPIDMEGADYQQMLGNVVTFDLARPGDYRFETAPMRGDPYVVSLFPMDANNLLYSDANGLWQIPFDLGGEAGSFVRLIENSWENNPDNYYERGYQPVAWTPGSQDGLLMIGAVMEGAHYLMFDPASRTTYDVPDSGFYIYRPGVSLLSGSELAVINVPMEGAPTLYTYSLYQDGADSGPIQGVFEKSAITLGDPIKGYSFDGPEQRYNIMAPYLQPEAGKILLAIASNVSADNGLWTVDPLTGAMTRLNDFPPGAQRATWVPDGSGVLVETYVSSEDGSELSSLVDYVPADGGPIVSLNYWLGMTLADFHWVK